MAAGTLVLTPAAAGPIALQSAVELFGSKTAKVQRLHVRLQYADWVDGGKSQTADLRVWFDKVAGQYLAVDAWRAMPRPGGAGRSWSVGVLASRKSATLWNTGTQDGARRYRVSPEAYLPDEKRLASGNFARSFVLDALVGYRNLCRVFAFRPAESPIAEQKNLRWFKVQANRDQPEHKNLGWSTDGGNQTWLGFDGESGWLKALVTEAASGWRSVTIATAIEADPDLEGVFVLPPEIRDLPLLDPKTQKPVAPD